LGGRQGERVATASGERDSVYMSHVGGAGVRRVPPESGKRDSQSYDGGAVGLGVTAAEGTGAVAQRIGWAVVWVQAGGYKGSGGYGGGAEGYLVVGDGDGPPFKGSSLCASMYV
jgi:hypothetical protein